MNLNQAIELSAAKFSDKIAIFHGERHISYSDLMVDIASFAKALSGRGVAKGDRVALYLNNSIEFVIAYLGTLKLGAVAVLLDPKYKQLELFSLLEDCRPCILISDSDSIRSLIVKQLPSFVKCVVLVGGPEGDLQSFKAFLTSASAPEFFPAIEDGDLAHIAYTSGPSFQPRGVVVTHGNLVKEIEVSIGSFAQSSNDIVLQFALPMHHVIGLVVVLLAALRSGDSLVILDGVSMESLASTIERYRITMFLGVPFIHAMLLRKIHNDGIKHDLSSLRVTGSAGDILPFSVVEGYRKLLGRKLVNFYGLTETLGHVTCETLTGESIQGNAGRVLPGWRIRVVDSAGCELPPCRPGEIIITGPMMKGYYRKPRINHEIMRRGWLHTGDLGFFDEETHLHVLGLQKDMLICKGQNIFPSDIEYILSQHPAVAEVAVAGVPDEIRGEVVGAAVVLKSQEHTSEAALTKYCLERLTNYKVPKYFMFLGRLPLDEQGRIDKRTLKDSFIKQFLKAV
jgi:long-chain acyl-CoA synthetase